MAVPARPIITSPNNGRSFSTNITTHIIGGTTDTSTLEIKVNGSTQDVTYNAGETGWSVRVDTLKGANVFEVVASNNDGDSLPTSIVINRFDSVDLDLVITPPTGIVINRRTEEIRIEWVRNPEPQVVEYRVYYSLEPGGGTAGFERLSSDPIESPVRQDKRVLEEESEVIETSTTSVETTTTQFVIEDIFQFIHTTNPDGSSIDAGREIYYRVTAVGFDPETNELVESAYSAEQFGALLNIGPIVRDLVPRTFEDLRDDLRDRSLDARPELDTEPNSYTRDIEIDPTATEFRRLFVLIDFVNRASSFLTLDPFDDADGDGVSDEIDSSPEKRRLRDALGATDVQTQTLIDEAFDKNAADYGVVRLSAQRARGEVTFYVDTAPTTDRVIPIGSIVSTSGSQNSDPTQYRTTVEVTLPTQNAEAFFNKATRRYEISTTVEAITAGAIGNKPAGAVNSVVSGVGLKVTNEFPIRFGTDRESNSELSFRAQLSIVGFDTNSKNGLLRESIEVPGVFRAFVVYAGNEYMFRDYDPIRARHTFGMTDIYLLGSVFNQINKQFGFYYPVRVDTAAIEDILALIFVVVDPEVTRETPLFEILRVTNVTRGEDYDLTNVEIIGGTKIQLDNTLPINIGIGLNQYDTIEVEYRFSPIFTVELDSKPFNSYVSVTGNLSGDLAANIQVITEDDPLLLGRSQKTSDRVTVIPSFTVTDEEVTLVDVTPVELAFTGVQTGSAVVTDLTGATVYQEVSDYIVTYGGAGNPTSIARVSVGSSITDGETVLVTYQTIEPITPVDDVETIVDEQVKLDGVEPGELLNFGVLDGTVVVADDRGAPYELNRDYILILGDQVTRTTIARTGPSSRITDGGTVNVSYQSGENVTFSYVINDLIQEVTEKVEEDKTTASNNLVKEAFEVPVSVVMNITVKRELNPTVSEIKRNIATVIANLFNSKFLGEGVSQSDIVGLVELVPAVDTVELPLVRLARDDRSLILRERLENTYFTQVGLGAGDVYVAGIADVEEIITEGTDALITFTDLLGETFTSLRYDALINRVQIFANGQFNSVDEVPTLTWVDTGLPVVLLSPWTGVGTEELEAFIDPNDITFIAGGQIRIGYKYSQEQVLQHPTAATGGYLTSLQTSDGAETDGTRINPVRVVLDNYTPLVTVETEAEVALARGNAYIREDGKIVFTTPDNSSPDNFIFDVTYLVFNENRVGDIVTSPLEYPRLQELIINITN